MGKGKVIAGTGLTAAVAAAALFLSQHGCSGFGFGNGDSAGNNSGTVQSEDNSDNSKTENTTVAPTEASTTALQPEIVTAAITIDGRDYIYNNKKMTLDELMAELNSVDILAEIYITCESSATVNAKESLEAELKSKGFNNIVFKS